MLDWLAREERILLTHDVRTMPNHVYERIRSGLTMPGIIVVRRNIPKRQAIDELEIMIAAGSSADFENLVRYIPIR